MNSLISVLSDSAAILAQPADPGQPQPGLSTVNLRDWMLDNVIPLLLLGVAVLLLWLGGSKGDNAAVLRRVGGVIIALGVIGLAVSGSGTELGVWISGLFSG